MDDCSPLERRNAESSAQAQGSEDFLCSPQRRGDPPACRMLHIVNVLAQFLVARSSRPAIRICKQPNRMIDVEARSQKLGETLGRVEGDIVQPVELVDDHHLDQLVEAERTAMAVVFAWGL